MQPRISVVIPLYNKERYVEQTLASVLRQEYPAHEVIVVDDGSTDGGAERVGAIGDARVRLLRQPNRGVSAARNRGIEEATGDHVAFLDADDYWAPSYLATIVELIARLPGCGIYATHFYYYRDDGFRQVPRLWGIDRRAGAQRVERFFEIWSHGVFFCTCSVVIPLAVLRESSIRFPEGEQHGEDQDVWFRIAERLPIGYLGEPLVGYRVDVPGGLAGSFAESALPCVQRLAARYRAHALPERHRKGVARMLGSTRLVIARHLLQKGQRARAAALLYDASALRLPRFWLRLFLAAHVPAFLRRGLIS